MNNPNKKRKADSELMGSTDSDVKTGGHEETGLDRIRKGWEIHRGPPNYTHVVLPWVYEQKSSLVGLYSYDYGIRMTSVYDPFITSTGTDQNSGAGTAMAYRLENEATDSRFSSGYGVGFWDYYKGLYKYYSVLGCRYKIRVENLSNERFYVHTMFINDTDPPSEASNWDMMMWQGVKSHLLHPIHRWANGGVVNMNESNGIMIDDEDTMTAPGTYNNTGAYIGNPVGSSFAYIAGEYRPGDHQHEVHQDDDVEIFTPVTRNPTLREALLLRLRPYDNATYPTAGDANTYQRELSWNITIECEYLCEFKELDQRLRWPVSRNPLGVTISTNPR